MKSNIEWKDWGERDPLYAVALWEGKQRGAKAAWTDEEFYELGRSDWADFQRHWTHYGLDAGSCVEIGCGAGRMTKQLGQYFQQVTALDVSQHQLDYARQRIPGAHVTFKLSGGVQLPINDAAFGAAFSVHVFQHFESHKDAYGVFRELYRALKPGGTIMIHLPIYELPDAMFSALFPPVINLAKRISDFRAQRDRRRLLQGKWTFVMRRLRFERQQLLGELRKIGFTEIEFRNFAVGSNHAYHEFVFAKKRA